MSLIKKSDVKNHLSNRHRNRNGIHLQPPASQPDATGFSGEQSERADSSATNTVEEQGNRPSASGLEKPDSSGLVTAADSKSAQA
jgi:hypothetical protein